MRSSPNLEISESDAGIEHIAVGEFVGREATLEHFHKHVEGTLVMPELDGAADQGVPREDVIWISRNAGGEKKAGVVGVSELGSAANAEGREGGSSAKGGGDEKAMELFELLEGAVANQVRDLVLDGCGSEGHWSSSGGRPGVAYEELGDH